MATPEPSASQSIAPRFMQPLRAMPIKVVYTLNDNIHQFFLARHTPIAVRVIQKPSPSRRQRQRAAKELRAQHSGTNSAPSSAKKLTPSRSRLDDTSKSQGSVIINVDDDSEEHSLGAEERVEYGTAPLKVCISAVWAASPDLAYDRTRDWSIYWLDPFEQSAITNPPASDVASKFSGVMTGMGLASHAMAEDDRIMNPVSVTGQIIEDQGDEALEIILQMKATIAPTTMMPQYPPGWPQHPMMYGFPQHPAMFRPPIPPPGTFPNPNPNPRPQASSKRTKSSGAISASTPAPSDAATPDATTTPSRDASVEPVKMARATSSEPKPTQTKKKKPVGSQTGHPLTRVPSQSANKRQSSSSNQPQTGNDNPLDIFASLATRLNSIDGGTEPPPPDTAEGQLLDCMVAWLKSAAGTSISGVIGFSGDTPAASSSQATDATSPTEAATSPADSSEVVTQSQSTSSQSAEDTSQRTARSSQAGPSQPSTSTSTNSKNKSGRVVLGNKSNTINSSPSNKSGGEAKKATKPLAKRPSVPNAPRKRAAEEEEHDTVRPKRQKIRRSISGSLTGISFTAGPSNQVNTSSATGRGFLAFPSSSEILGIKLAPRRATQTAMSQETEDADRSSRVEPQTPTPKKKGKGASAFSLAMTSPYVAGHAMDDSLFSDAGTPAVPRNFSPFKAVRRPVDQIDALAEEIRPSSPCERRANAGSGRSKEQKSPLMLGQSLSRSPSPSETRTPQPLWAVDLPPSSPPPPSSPNASLTPAEGEDEEEPLEELLEEPATESEGPTTEESPSKAFSRMFNIASNVNNDLTSALLSGPSSDSKEFDFGFDFGFANIEGSSNLAGRSSSSSSVFDDFGWSDGLSDNFLGGEGKITGNSSEAEFDVENENAESTDLDFNIGELLSWMQRDGDDNSQNDTQPGETNEQSTDSATTEEDPLRTLLSGCLV